MKLSIQHFLLMILILALGIHVKGFEGEVEALPESCDLMGKDSCSIKVTSDVFSIKNRDFSIKASKDSVFRKHEKSIQFIEGLFFIDQISKDQIIETTFGNLLDNQRNFWVLVFDDKIVIRNTGYTDVYFKKRDGETIAIPVGFQNWISGIGNNKKNSYGMIRPIDLNNHLREWFLFFDGSKADFHNEVREAKERWGDLLETSSLLYRFSVDQKIEAEHKIEIEKQRQRNLELSIRKKYRDLLLEKALGT